MYPGGILTISTYLCVVVARNISIFSLLHFKAPLPRWSSRGHLHPLTAFPKEGSIWRLLHKYAYWIPLCVTRIHALFLSAVRFKMIRTVAWKEPRSASIPAVLAARVSSGGRDLNRQSKRRHGFFPTFLLLTARLTSAINLPVCRRRLRAPVHIFPPAGSFGAEVRADLMLRARELGWFVPRLIRRDAFRWK